MEANYSESNLKFYSIGIVAYDKLDSTDIISVIPIESLSSLDKDAKAKVLEGTHKGTKVHRQYTILAKWFPNGSDNRITPPDVYANESVKIFRYADEDKYYWTTMFYEENIRRLEHVTYSFSNQPSGTFNPVDKNSSYYVTCSTKKKYIHLHTSTNNGEASGYDILINTKTGELSIIDTQNNQVLIQSPQKRLQILNFNEINVQTANQINITCPTNTINGNVNINGNLKVSGTINAGESVTAPTFNGNLNGNASTASSIG